MGRAFLLLFFVCLKFTFAADFIDINDKDQKKVIGTWYIDLQKTFDFYYAENRAETFPGTFHETLDHLSKFKFVVGANKVTGFFWKDFTVELKEFSYKAGVYSFNLNGYKESFEIEGNRLISLSNESFLTGYKWTREEISKEKKEELVQALTENVKSIKNLREDFKFIIILNLKDLFFKALSAHPEKAQEHSGDGITLLHKVCKYKRFEMIEYLLVNHSKTLDIPSSVSPLQFLIQGAKKTDEDKFIKILNLLLKNELDINFASGLEKQTALIYSARNNKINILPILFKNGADHAKVDVRGFNYLHYICLNESFNKSTIDYAFENHKDLFYKENKSKIRPIDYIGLNKNKELLKYAIKLGLDFKVPRSNGTNILHCLINNLDAMKVIVESFEDINLESKHPETGTLLRTAIIEDEIEVIQYFLSKGAKIPEDYDPSKVIPSTRRGRILKARMVLLEKGQPSGLFCSQKVHEIIKAYLEKK